MYNTPKIIWIIILSLAVIGISVGLSVLFDKDLVAITDNNGDQTQVGALTGPIIPYNYFGFGGVLRVAGSMSMKTSTSTPCRIKGPAATSTLIFASADFRYSTSSAIYVELGKTTNAASYATTTSLGIYEMPANDAKTIIASSTPTTGGKTTFNPNDWLVVKVAGATGATGVSGWTGFSPTGSCKAEWIVDSD